MAWLLQSGDAFEPIECVSVAGDDLHFWYANAAENTDRPGFLASYEQIFDEGTIQRLRRLSIAVVGASGTGSPVIEQLVRLGVGEIIIVDDDHMEDRNVNRILNSTMRDVRKKHATNAIESLNYSLRKIVKGRGAFPNDDAVRKLLYLGLREASKKWKRPIRDWKAALNQFVILYGDRVPIEQ